MQRDLVPGVHTVEQALMALMARMVDIAQSRKGTIGKDETQGQLNELKVVIGDRRFRFIGQELIE